MAVELRGSGEGTGSKQTPQMGTTTGAICDIPCKTKTYSHIGREPIRMVGTRKLDTSGSI